MPYTNEWNIWGWRGSKAWKKSTIRGDNQCATNAGCHSPSAICHQLSAICHPPLPPLDKRADLDYTVVVYSEHRSTYRTGSIP